MSRERVGGYLTNEAKSFTRPGDTNVYASGDLVANSTTAGSVAPMVFSIGRLAGFGGALRRARLRKSGTGVTGASFRLHLFSSAPVFTNGDNGAFLCTKSADYLGAFDIIVDRAFADGAVGIGVPVSGAEILFLADNLYGVLEAQGAYTPVSGEVFQVTLEGILN